MTTVDLRSTANILGAILRWYAVPFVVPLVVALVEDEPLTPYLVPLVLTLLVGVALERLEREQFYDREAFLVVAFSWLGLALVGTVPFLIEGSGVFADPVNALFESMSGVTTTGATVILDFDAHSRSLLMWRQVLQWLGGLGILLLATAVLSRLSVAGAQLMETESQSSEVTKLTTRIEGTAKILGGLYLGLTVAAALVLFALGVVGAAPAMTLYDAVAHAFTSVATAGFSPRAESAGAFAPIVHWVLAVFMALGATNFVLMYNLTQGNPDRIRRSEEFRAYVAVLAAASLLVFLLLLTDADYDVGLLTALRESVFQVVSIVTTTGYASTDYNAWSSAAKHVLFILMFSGGMAGSTTCSIKVLRWLIVVKGFRRDLQVASYPGVVKPVRLSGDVVEEETIRDVYAYTLLALLIFIVATVLVVADSARTARSVEEFEVMTAVASTFFNVGPAFGRAGPFGTYEWFSGTSKLLMVLLMWVGRIEIIPVLVLLTPTFWRR